MGWQVVSWWVGIGRFGLNPLIGLFVVGVGWFGWFG